MKIQVAHYVYKIEFVPDPSVQGDSEPESLDGCCDHTKLKIFLRENMTKHHMSDTLMHEIMHAIWHAVGLNSFDGVASEEMYVGVMSPLLVQALNSNKKVRELILHD